MEILFTYLAISKIIYWMNTITTMRPSSLPDVGVVFLHFLDQNLLLIIGVVAFYFLNRLIESKKSKSDSKIWEFVVFYAIGFVVLMAISFLYFFVMLFFISPIEGLSVGVFVRQFIGATPDITLSYLIIIVILEIKLYFKKKGKKLSEDVPSAQSPEENLAMLKALRDADILTQEEFNRKKRELDIGTRHRESI